MKRVSSVRRCRLCASEDILNDFYNIFEDRLELKLEMKIRKLLPVVVLFSDPMPNTVCRNCTHKLNTFYEFYETSLNAEEFLRTLHCETPTEAKTPPLDGVKKDAEKRKKALEMDSRCFVRATSGCSESSYTCPQCCRRFTKEDPPLLHSCEETEDSDDLETDKKFLPPLKIRLFAVRSGLFVCCLCKKRFEDKGELGKHIKGHFLEGSWGDEEGNKEGEKTVGCCREGGEERRGVTTDKRRRRRRRKRSLWSPKNCGRTETVPEDQNWTCGEDGSNMEEEKICSTSPSTIETTEDKAENPQPEWDAEMKDDSKLVTKEPGEGEMEKPEDEVTVLEVLENKVPTILSSCVLCDKIFATTASLLAHKSKHLKDFRSKSDWGDPFLCDVCPKTFPTERTLLEHLRGHSWKPLEGQRRVLAPLNQYSPGEAVWNDWGIVSSGQDEVPFVEMT